MLVSLSNSKHIRKTCNVEGTVDSTPGQYQMLHSNRHEAAARATCMLRII